MKLQNRFIALFLVVTLVSLSGMVTAAQLWKFRVFLDDQEIGKHTFKLTPVDDMTHIEIRANFDVYFLFFHAYSYRHTNYETWNGQCLESIRSETDDNGIPHYVTGEYKEQKFHIRTAEYVQTVEGCINTFAYWNPAFLKNDYLLNAQTGELMPVSVDFLGEEIILVRGKLMAAKRYRLISDDFTIDVWYSDSDEWIALNSTTSDGNTLRYQIM